MREEMDNQEVLLTAEHLHKEFDGTVILKDMNLSVKRGEVIVIIRLRKEHISQVPERPGDDPGREDHPGRGDR